MSRYSRPHNLPYKLPLLLLLTPSASLTHHTSDNSPHI